MPPLNYVGFIPSQDNSCDSEPLLPEPEPVAPAAEALPTPIPHTPPPAPSTVPSDTTSPEADPGTDGPPVFKTDKERECWQMFRKMADKGVTVSYDTVLRGMLTPTEYRLHKKSMSASC